MARRPFYSELMGKLTSFLSAQETTPTIAPPERPAKPGAAPASSARPLSMVGDPVQRYEERLATAVSGHGSAVSGRMQLVNLAKVSESFGARWPKVEKNVHSIIEGILARRLSPADFYVHQGGNDYYFLFSGLSEADAKIKCALLTSEIMASLIGDEAGKAELAGLDFRTVVAQVDGAMDTAGATLEAVEGLLSRKQAEEAPAVSARADLTALPKAQLKGLLPLFEAIERELKQWRETAPGSGERKEIVARLEGVGQLLRQAEDALASHVAAHPAAGQDETAGAPDAPIATLSSVKTALEDAGAPAHTGPEWQLFNVLPGLIARTLSKIEAELKRQGALLGLGTPQAPQPRPYVLEPVSRERPPFDWSAGEVVFSYLPMWQISKKAINSYLCQLALQAGDEIHPLEALFDDEIDEVVIASLDRLVLRESLKSIGLLLKSGQRNNIVVPVHFATLASSRARREYLGVLSLVRPEHRPYLIWELSYPHVGISNSPILQAASLLRPYGRKILLRVRIDYRHFDNLAVAGIYAVGTDIADKSTGEASTIHKMDTFRARVEQAGLKAYLHGANSLSLATAAVCAGFDHIDGDVIARSIDNPEGIHSYRIETPYTAIFNAAGI